MPNFISEDTIEKAILKRLKDQFGYELLNCHTTDADDLNDRSGRSNKRDVIFSDRLKEAAIRLNPGIPESAIDEALEKLADKRYAMSPIAANREVDSLIRDGIPVEFENAQGRKEQEQVRVIDFDDPDRSKNRYLAVTQLWIKGERNYRRPDICSISTASPWCSSNSKIPTLNSNPPLTTTLPPTKKTSPNSFSATPSASSPTP